MFLVVNKAPANLVNPITGAVIAVFPETGVYFAHYTDSKYVSSLSIPAKSEIVPIPGELTNIVGGYVGKERKDPLIDAVVPASSFELDTTSSETYYEAPITLGFTPSDGDIIEGTINGVKVRGEWLGGGADLDNDSGTNICSIELLYDWAAVMVYQASAPTTDYELHLYRYVPSGIVQIPQEYVEGLEETTANASEALNNATEAQSTANEIKNVVQPADTYNNGIKIKWYIGFKEVLGQYSSPAMPSDINGRIYLRKSSNQTGVNLVIDNGTSGVGAGASTSIGSDGLMLTKNSKVYAPVTPSSYGPIISIYNDNNRAYVEFTKAACLVLPSSTTNSTKKFKITVDDTGTISATEVT